MYLLAVCFESNVLAASCLLFVFIDILVCGFFVPISKIKAKAIEMLISFINLTE